MWVLNSLRHEVRVAYCLSKVIGSHASLARKLATPNSLTLGVKTMQNLRRLGLSFTLVSVLAMTAIAGETPTPPCAPGETHSPPCASAQMMAGDSVAPGQTDTPPAANNENEFSFAAEAIDLLQSVLSIF
jgi:hypothetical protein